MSSDYYGAIAGELADAGRHEDTAEELVGWLADSGVHLADGRGAIPRAAARAMVQRFLESRALGWRRAEAGLSAHQEAAILDTLPDEVLERLPGHDGPGHTEDGPADCRRCALLREHGPAFEEAARRLRAEEGL